MPRQQPTTETVSIGDRIQRERERLGITREEVAEMMEITPGFVTDIERGRTGLTIHRLIQICNIFHCSADYLLFGKVSLENRLEQLPDPLHAMIDDIVVRQIKMIDYTLKYIENK